MSEIQSKMEEFIDRYHLWNRVAVGEETSKLTRELAEELEADVLSVPSGAECLTWIIPPGWRVKEAYVETLAGERLIDFEWHPLYLKSYSGSFFGEVSREELIEHCYSEPDRPQQLCYQYQWQYEHGGWGEDWGFSVPHELLQELDEESYRVNIDTEFYDATMDVLDLIVPGKSEETIFWAAHTCHPGQVNDGLACIAVLREFFKWMKKQPKPEYTHRLILGPEYFAAAGFLARAEGVEELKYGFYLDMLGNGKKLGFSHSFQGDTYIDKLVKNIFKHQVSDYLETDYRELWGNDEMFYDGPDFEIPVIPLGRDYFDAYHTADDNLDNCDFDQLEEAYELLVKIWKTIENDKIPVRKYIGPLYMSRFDVEMSDELENAEDSQLLNKLQILIDGNHSAAEIAEKLNLEVESLLDFLCKLESDNLIEFITMISDEGD